MHVVSSITKFIYPRDWELALHGGPVQLNTDSNSISDKCCGINNSCASLGEGEIEVSLKSWMKGISHSNQKYILQGSLNLFWKDEAPLQFLLITVAKSFAWVTASSVKAFWKFPLFPPTNMLLFQEIFLFLYSCFLFQVVLTNQMTTRIGQSQSTLVPALGKCLALSWKLIYGFLSFGFMYKEKSSRQCTWEE